MSPRYHRTSPLGSLPLLLCATAVAWGTGSAAPTAVPAAQNAGVSTGAPYRKMLVYVGTYTQRGSKGIYVAELHPETGALSAPKLVAETRDPSFLAIHPSRKYLYAANETVEYKGQKSGFVTAFSIDPQTGGLKELNQQPSKGGAPCHLVVDRQGLNVLVANYVGGNITALPIRADGQLGEPSGFVQHEGSSVDKRRQEGPHAHSINLDRNNRFAFAADLGLDKVLVYRFDVVKGTLAPHDPAAASVAPGSGPRHFAFHPSTKFAYVINEMLSTVTAFQYDEGKGTLASLQTLKTIPPGFTGNTSTAEVQVHPSGKFLYGSNRGHDSIAIFTIDQRTGMLTPAGHQPTGGKTPRNFGIDPSGRFLLAANQDSNSIHVFKIDPETGKLTPTGSSIEVPMPVCVKFLLVN